MENFGSYYLDNDSNESSVSTATQVMEKKEETISLDFIVLAVDNKVFNIDKPTYELKIYGKSMLDMVKNVCDSEPKVKVVTPKHNVLDEIRSLLGNGDITVVLYSDSPLITKNTISEAVNHLISNGLNVVKLTHGYIFKTEYVKRAFDIFSTETFYSNEEDFLVATNFKQLSLITEIQKNRILSYHMKNGVFIVDPSTTFIDQDVSFGRNVIIYPNNIIYGKIEAGDNVTFYSDNVIGDSVIKNNIKIMMSRIKKSVIESGSNIRESSIESSLIGEDCKINMGSRIVNSMLRKNVAMVGAMAFNAVIGDNSILNSMSAVISYLDGRVTLKSNVIIGAHAIVQNSVTIEDNTTILPSSVVTTSVEANSIYGEKKIKETRPKA